MLVVCEIDKLITDKESVLSLTESETEWHVHIYLQLGKHASAPIEGQVKGSTRPTKWYQSVEHCKDLLQHSKKKSKRSS